MQWESFVEDGSLVVVEGTKADALSRVNEAWDGAIRARKCYAEHDFQGAFDEVRGAMTIAGESLCLYYGYRFADAPTFESVERVCDAFFKPDISQGVFDRARILGEMLPLPDSELDADTGLRVRHSIGASAELCAMVESFVFFQ